MIDIEKREIDKKKRERERERERKRERERERERENMKDTHRLKLSEKYVCVPGKRAHMSADMDYEICI